jgi:hypothetical protein
MKPRSSLPWYHRLSPWLGGLFGFLGALYTISTGEYLSWRMIGEEPLLPMDTLFEVYPLLGIAVFTVVGFSIGWLERYLGRRRAAAR